MSIDAAGAASLVQYRNMDEALGAGDLEAVMLMLGIERASTAEEVVKVKIQEIRLNNAKIQKLNEVLEKIQGKDDKDGKVTGLTDAEVELLRGYGIKVDDYVERKVTREMIPGRFMEFREVTSPDWTLKDDGKLALLREAISNQVKSLSSNDQLQMIELQSAVSKQNNAVEMVSTTVKKFGELRDSIVRKF